MNEHLQAAIDFAQGAADNFGNALPMRGIENIQLSLAAAAIAQAEAAERQAQAMESILEMLDAIITEPQAKAPYVINTYDLSPK